MQEGIQHPDPVSVRQEQRHQSRSNVAGTASD